MKRWPVETQVLAGFSLAVAALAVVGASLYYTTVRFIDTSEAVSRSQRALTALEGIYSLMNQAETQQRGYLLLGGAVDLVPRHAAVTRMKTLVADLGQLTADDPVLQARLPELERRIAERLRMLDAVLEARRTRGFEAGQRQLAASPGRAEMQKLHELVVLMQTEEHARLEQRQQAARRSAQRTLVMLGLLLVLAVAALAALYARIRRESRERREGEERLHAVVATAVDGIITIDERGLIDAFNPAAERMLGYPVAEVLGRNVSLLMPEPERSRHDGYLRRYLETGEKRVIGMGHEVLAQRRDGTVFPVELTISELDVPGRRLFTGILRDISERKQAEAYRAELLHNLEDANEELRNFAYVVSHDLKAPLRGIGSLADWLNSDYADRLDDRGREYLALMKNRATRMDALIDGILEYSRVGRIRETRVAVDVNGLVGDVVQLLAPPAGVAITVDGPLPTVIAERTRLQQLFQNLIGNAIQHLDKPAGEIRIACADEGSRWRFSIADNGPGIDPRHHERIFQLFQTLTPRDRKESTGVGLALVRKIVELYGGRVWVESEAGKGSTFFFTLPKAGASTMNGDRKP